jgi:hypothetical protein
MLHMPLVGESVIGLLTARVKLKLTLSAIVLEQCEVKTMNLKDMTDSELEDYADSLFQQVCADFGNVEPAEKLHNVLTFIENKEAKNATKTSP